LNVSGTQWLAQRVVPHASGFLHAVVLDLDSTTTQTVVVEIRQGSTPDGTAVAAEMTATVTPGLGTDRFELSASVPITAGTPFLIVAHLTSAGYISWNASNNNPYEGALFVSSDSGATFHEQVGSDAAFQTDVGPSWCQAGACL
jgi:hypothetical protein